MPIFKHIPENVKFSSIIIVYTILQKLGLTFWDAEFLINNYSNFQNSDEIFRQSRIFDYTKPSLVKDEFVDSIQIQVNSDTALKLNRVPTQDPETSKCHFELLMGKRLSESEEIVGSENPVEQNVQDSLPKILSLQGGDLSPKSGPGPRAKSDDRKVSKTKTVAVAYGLTNNPGFLSRPGQTGTGGPINHVFSQQSGPDPSNPGYSRGPKSVTVLSVGKEEEFNDMLLKFNQPQSQDVMTNREALELIAETYPGQMEVTANERITDWQAAKKAYHFQKGFDVDLGKYPTISKEDLVSLQNTEGGLVTYIQKGGKLPPIELIRDCQQKIYDFCHLENTEINRNVTHYGKNSGETPCIMFFNRETRQITLFNKTSGDLITAEKFRQNYFTKCINYGQVGKPTN